MLRLVGKNFYGVFGLLLTDGVALVWSSPISVKVFKCPTFLGSICRFSARVVFLTPYFQERLRRRSQSGVKKSPPNAYLISVGGLWSTRWWTRDMCNCHTVGFHNARNAHFSLALLMNFDKPFKEATPKKCAEFHTWRILVDFYVLLSIFLNRTAGETIISSLDIPAN